jgi:hypothetical protein
VAKRFGRNGRAAAVGEFPVGPDWPAARPEFWPLERIIPYPQNARTHPEAQIALLARLMREHGVDQPIVVDEAGVVLKGHGRLLAAKLAKFPVFPVAQHFDKTEVEKVAMRLEDNQLALLSGWDHELIRGEFQILKTAGYDMPLLGFDSAFVQWSTEGALVLDPTGEWGGMPHFNNPDAKAFRSIVVHFKDQESVDLFAAAVGHNITEKTKFLWYPDIEIKPFVKVAGDGQ